MTNNSATSSPKGVKAGTEADGDALAVDKADLTQSPEFFPLTLCITS